MIKKVSIIIPFYKNIKYLKKAINSILMQTYKNYEIIIIYDDNIKDDLKIINKKFKDIKKLKIIINKKNLGAGESRNIGVAESKGYYIAFLDADDFWKNKKLEKQIEFMDKNSLDLSYSSYEILNAKSKIKHKINETYTYFELLNKCDIGLSTVILKSKIFKKGKFPNLKTQEDYALWLKYSRKGIKMKGINKSLSYWRNTPGSMSKNTMQKLKDSFKVYYILENKNFFESLLRVFILSINKIFKIYKNKA